MTMAVKPVARLPEAPAWDGPTVAVQAGAGRAADAIETASHLSATEDFHDQIGFLLQHVGPRVVWAALGLKDPRMLTKWLERAGAPKSEATFDRVHLLFVMAYAVTSVFDGATAARFLRVRSPYLGYVSPADVLREGKPEEVGRDLLVAAGQFLNA
jgi:hypothetical protein